MELQKIPFWNLLKLELPAAARSVINIVEKHDPEELQIKEVYDLLVAQLPNIELLKQPYGAHPLTGALIPARKRCLMYGQTSMYKMGVVMKEREDNLTVDIRNANAFMNQHLHRLDLCKNDQILTERITDFITELTASPELTEIFDTLKMTEDFNHLKAAFSAFNNLLMRRGQLYSERPSEKAKDVAKPVRKAIKDLFKQIEVAELKHAEIDYKPLISELNQKIVEIKNTVNRRKLHNKKKAEGMDVNGSDNESTNSGIESTPMTTSLNVGTIMGNGFEEGFDNQLDQKKTVAPSSKQTQLPNLNKED